MDQSINHTQQFIYFRQDNRIDLIGFFNPVDHLVQIPGPNLDTIIVLSISDIYRE